MNFAKFLRTPFLTEHLWWLLLSFDFHSGLLTVMISIDLLKVFGTLHHHKIFKEQYWFLADAVQCFRSYLSDRHFTICTDMNFLNFTKTLSGCHKGFFLAHGNFYLYADDFCLIFQYKDLKNNKLVTFQIFVSNGRYSANISTN